MLAAGGVLRGGHGGHREPGERHRLQRTRYPDPARQRQRGPGGQTGGQLSGGAGQRQDPGHPGEKEEEEEERESEPAAVSSVLSMRVLAGIAMLIYYVST